MIVPQSTPNDPADAEGPGCTSATGDSTGQVTEQPNVAATDLPGRPLTDAHRRYLAGEGIGSYVRHLADAGWVRSTEPGDPLPDDFNLREERQRGIWFAYPKADGSIRWQIKPDVQDDGEPKYVSAKGGPLGYALRRRGTSDLVIVAEGTKQSLAAAAAVEAAATGFARDAVEVANSTVIGIPGVTGWSEDGALPFDFHRLCQGKRVVIMTDKDAATNIDVYQGAERLGQALTLATSVAYAPNPGGGKDGLDDVLKQVEEAERPGLLAAIVAGASNKPATKKPPAKTIVTDDMLPASGASLVITSADAYDRIARELIDRCFMHATEKAPTLAFNGGLWWTHTGSRWEALEDNTIPGMVWTLLASAVIVDNPGDAFGRPYPISKYRRDNVLEGLRARLATDPPKTQTAASYWIAWHNGKWRHTADPAGPVIACSNGLLTRSPDPATGQRNFYAHTPRYWNLTSLAVAYDPAVTESEALDKLLMGAWPDDPDCRQLALEVIGYIASGDMSLQKIFFFWGPKRAGKGKLLDVLTLLVGESQVEASGLSEMSRPFGIENWIEKGLAILDDARDEHVDVGLLSRRMLSVSGCAMTPVERKGIKNWSGRLATRIVITSNLLIELRDPAGVLASRLEVLPFAKSFYGAEDLTLGNRLEAQMSAILNLGLAAYDRMTAESRGFIRPASAARDHEMLATTQSAEEQFLEESCVLGPEERDSKIEVYRAYTRWCDETGRKGARTEASFFRVIYSITGRAVYPVKAAPSEGRQPMVQGMRIRRATDGLNAAIRNGSLIPTDPGQVVVHPQFAAAGVRDGVRDVSGVANLAGHPETPGQRDSLSGVSGVSGQGGGCGRNDGIASNDANASVCFTDQAPGHPGHPGQVDSAAQLASVTTDAAIVGLHFAPANGDQAATVTVATDLAAVALTLDSAESMAALRSWLKSPACTLSVYDGPKILGALADAGLCDLGKLWSHTVDARILDQLLQPGDGKTFAHRSLGEAMRRWFPHVKFVRSMEASATAMLAAHLLPGVPDETRVREHTVAATVHGAARRGMVVDKTAVTEAAKVARAESDALAVTLRDRFGVYKPEASGAVKDAFARLGVTLAGDTSRETLQSLPLTGEAAELRTQIIGWRQASAAVNNDLAHLAATKADADGVHRARPIVDTLGAVTGRFTTSEPPVAALRKDFRPVLCAEPGHVLVSADYASIEIRVAAALSGDTALIERLKAGVDPYTAAAELAWGAPADEMQAAERRQRAKAVLLGWLYGSGDELTATQIRTTVEEAKRVRTELAAAMPQLAAWVAGEIERIRNGGAVATATGRLLAVHPSRAATCAVNRQVQGTARDLLALAIERLVGMGWGKFLWLTVHDEVVLQVPEGAAAQAVVMLEQAMALSIGGVALPAKAEVLGTNWGKV
ncbi:DNA polymerase [Tsukamurella pseudospumae]|uniref:SF3 helicase domain-containing protein n=1 Tax=Tsukamurella pseudospumae TaxID=239498 RepID=A0A138AE68_9ACTN|nr:DNA polymerase [Tsukamurella pseudospumae]KXP08801.1 hypothetical protein AXK60_09045 [Tsukamurella pseudospumae]